MPMHHLGPSLRAKSGRGFEPQVATIFIDTERSDTATLVTEGSTHFRHREVYCDHLDAQRRAAGLSPLTASERTAIWQIGVDLIIQPDLVLIRPDAEQIDRALSADELLQAIVPKAHIRFQLASNDTIFTTLTERGELWRIAADAVTTAEMKECIRNSRMKLRGRPIYYYSPKTGTRFLTLKGLRGLIELGPAELHQHLVEIQEHCARYNSRGELEADFFLLGTKLRTAFCAAHFPADDEQALRNSHQQLCELFEQGVALRYRSDDLENPDWVHAMYDALYPQEEYVVDPHGRLRLAPEFRKHVKWLPGGRLRDGHLIYDPIVDEESFDSAAGDEPPENRRGRALIFNFVRDYGDLEYINAGWINESLSRAGRAERGRRDVYLVLMKRASEDRKRLHMVRMQKWDMTYRLDHGVAPDQAMFETEEYTEYTQDRYLGCRRLGMKLFGPVRVGKISERYQGKRAEFHDMPIWTPYFERDYVDGVASDRISRDRLCRPAYAKRLAELLGQAAAHNLVVGRGDGKAEEVRDEDLIIFFDDGDEIVIGGDDLPTGLVVMHHTGSFWHFHVPLCRFAAAYAKPVANRIAHLPDPAVFAATYVEALIDRFAAIQAEYRGNRRAYQRLFHLRPMPRDQNFSQRWMSVLHRLDQTDPAALKGALEARLRVVLGA